MDAPKPRYAACEVREQYVKHWNNDLLSAPSAACGFCCYALWCPCCASYGLRKRAIYNDMRRYLCCGGYCPCSGRMNEQSCPECCLCMEVFFCFSQSVASTRWMLQDEMQLQNTKCDNCIIGTTVAIQYLSCIISCVAIFVNNDGLREAAYILDLIADLLWISMCACMQTQHHIQIKVRDANRAQWVQPVHPMMVPLQQSMGIPAYGIPPPMAQGQAAGYAYGQQQQYQYQQQQPGYYPPPPGSYPPPPPPPHGAKY